MKTSRAAGTALAVLFMLLFLGALGVRFWASGEASRDAGPDHIAAGSDRVYVHVEGELVALSASGEIVSRRALTQLGLDDTPIDLRVLTDGRVLVAGQRPATLRLCTPERWQCESIGQGVTPKLNAQFKVAVDDDDGRLLITDAESGEIWVQRLAGGEPKAMQTRTVLDHPNDIVLDGNGAWVADSGHHRIVRLALTDDGVREAGSLEARHRLSRHDWPMMLARTPDGDVWVTQPDAVVLRGADLLVYRPESGVEARIDLPIDAYPTDIAALERAMLVTDSERVRVYRVDIDTRQVSEFGSAAFRDRLRQLVHRKARYREMSDQSLVAMIASGALMVLAAAWATPKGKRFTPRPVADPLAASEAAPPALDGIHWLKREPKTDRLLRWAAPLTTVLVVVTLGLLAGFTYLFGIGSSETPTPERAAKVAELQRLLFWCVIAFGSLPVLMRFPLQSMRARIGTDGHRLFVRQPDDRPVSFAPEQLVYGGRYIACRDRLFAVHTGNRQPLYAAGEIETYIAPLLRRARKLTAFGLFRYLLAHREPGTLASIVLSAILLAAFIFSGGWRHVFS